MSSNPVLISLYPFTRKAYILYQTQTAIVCPVRLPFVHLTSRPWAPTVGQVLTHTEVEMICYWQLLLSESTVVQTTVPRRVGPLPSSPCSSSAWYEGQDLEVGSGRGKYQPKDFLCLHPFFAHCTPGCQDQRRTPSHPQLPWVNTCYTSPRLPCLRLWPFPPPSRKNLSPLVPCSSGHQQHGLSSHMFQFLSAFDLVFWLLSKYLIVSTRLAALCV